ncbi:hypothetical protein F4777DRAFT_593783 [Nemania sp. FL0916]|nr:hypothetical protein F4777DRAFT_593783 [Nemania sp. FL0916]
MATAIETTMNYYLDPFKGGTHGGFGTVGVLRRKFDTHSIRITDLRGLEDQFDIHTHSFQASKWKPSITSLDPDDIKRIVFPEVEEFVKKITNATRVHCFSHLVRQNTVETNLEALKKLEASRGKDNILDNEGLGNPVPARYAHVDQSAKGARSLLNYHFPEEAERLTKTRWGTVNLWRPIQTIRRDPLCFCDGKSISDEDLVPLHTAPPPNSNVKYYSSIPRDGFQTLEVRASPKHEWYYISEMQPNEALIFKCYDSKDTSRNRCCHSSFGLPDTAHTAPRESMEFRFFVFYEDEPLHGI